MSSYIDLKFINEVSTRLGQFKKKGDYLFNFRCPYCGDSKTNKTKARGYVFRKESNLIYKCHNCGIGANLNNFLKQFLVPHHLVLEILDLLVFVLCQVTLVF